MSTTGYGLPTGKSTGDTLTATEANNVGALEAGAFGVLADLLGSGCRLPGDWNGSAGAGLDVDISAGAGIIGDAGSRLLRRTTGSINLAGLTASRDCYVFKNQTQGGTASDFQFLAVTIAAAAPSTPANTELVMIVTTGASTVTSVNNLPPGRHNLFGPLALADYAVEATVSTTDATVTTLLSYTPRDGCVTQLEARVVTRKSDGTAGAGYLLVATFRRAGATVTQIGSTTALATHEDNASYDATLDASGSAIRVRVTGVAATSLSWVCKASFVRVA